MDRWWLRLHLKPESNISTQVIHGILRSLAMTLTPHKFIQIWWQHLAPHALNFRLYTIPITLHVLCVNPCGGIDKFNRQSGVGPQDGDVVHGYRLPTDCSTQLSNMLLYWEEVSTSNYCHDTKCWSVAGVDHYKHPNVTSWWASSMVLNNTEYAEWAAEQFMLILKPGDLGVYVSKDHRTNIQDTHLATATTVSISPRLHMIDRILHLFLLLNPSIMIIIMIERAPHCRITAPRQVHVVVAGDVSRRRGHTIVRLRTLFIREYWVNCESGPSIIVDPKMLLGSHYPARRIKMVEPNSRCMRIQKTCLTHTHTLHWLRPKNFIIT